MSHLKPVPKKRFTVVEITRNEAKINEYEREIREAIDEMETYAPYIKLVNSSRAHIRKHKLDIYELLDEGMTETPEIPTKFGMIKFHLDRPFPSSTIAITEEALKRLDLDETMRKKYDEMELVVSRDQVTEIIPKLFLTRKGILDDMCDLSAMHRESFLEDFMSYKTDELSKFYTTKICDAAWHMYVLTQFLDESQLYKRAYNRAKETFTRMAKDPETQKRSFSYKDLKMQYIPRNRTQVKMSYNNLVKQTLLELSAESDSNLLQKFDRLLAEITIEQKTEVKDKWFRYYLDDVEYTLY